MIQCFAKLDKPSMLLMEGTPQVAYVSRTDEENSVHPRVMHAHKDLVEIVLVTSGHGRYSIGGTLYPIQKGDLMIYNSGVVHDEPSGPEDRTRRYCCAISGIKLAGLRENALTKDEESPVFHLPDKVWPRMEQLMETLFSSLVAGEESACHYLMMALLELCWSALHRANSNEAELEPNILGRRIKEYIDSSYMEDISLGSIAQKLNISQYYLAHVFKDMTGYSPMQYIVRRRIGEAQTLLISTHLSVTDIGIRVGYDNPSHFNQLFTKNVGMSPREYRRNYIVSEGKTERETGKALKNAGGKSQDNDS
ncbi:MAG: AraC family transcriptional regulator [Clostridia bacterium]|nr:AraC family transcriptional regulator [Clostridia bacterium]NCC43906.1 AraC family transcriptional regulator [Clostridia bacterium]